MKTAVKFNKKTLENAFKLHYDTIYPIRSRMMMFIGFFLWFVGMALIYFNYPEDYPFFKYLIALVGVFYIAMFYYRRKKMFERASNQSTFVGEFTFEVNTKEIVFGKDDKVSACQWAEIDNILQDEYNILFYFGKDKFYILPMESLSVEQEESINSIIQEKRINK
jgi:hypothetical protein